MTESIEDVAATDIVEDIAALARKLAETKPFASVSGADALRAFAAHLEAMVSEPVPTPVVEVAVRWRRKKRA